MQKVFFFEFPSSGIKYGGQKIALQKEWTLVDNETENCACCAVPNDKSRFDKRNWVSLNFIRANCEFDKTKLENNRIFALAFRQMLNVSEHVCDAIIITIIAFKMSLNCLKSAMAKRKQHKENERKRKTQ